MLSHYLPGGRAEWGPLPADTVYVVLDGTLVLGTAEAEHTLQRLDAAHLCAGTGRRLENHTTLPATVLVIRPTH